MKISFHHFSHSIPLRLSVYVCSFMVFFLLVGLLIADHYWSKDLTLLCQTRGISAVMDAARYYDRVPDTNTKAVSEPAEEPASGPALLSSEEADMRLAMVMPWVNREWPECRSLILVWKESDAAKETVLLATNQSGNYAVIKLSGGSIPQEAFVTKVRDGIQSGTTVLSLSSSDVACGEVSGLTGAHELCWTKCRNGKAIGVLVPLNQISKILFLRILKYLVLGLLGIAAIGVAVYYICSRIMHPLAELSQVAEVVGQGQFDSPITLSPRNDEVGKLSLSFTLMQKALTEYFNKLRHTLVGNERLAGELNAARKIQQDILPHVVPPMDGFTNINVVGSLKTARGVGGDLYDVFPSDSEHIAIVIGDVSGKGIPAALFMAVTQTLQRSLVRTEDLPDTLAEQMNRMLLVGNDANMFVTWWCGFLDIRNGELVYTNAGHNPPIIRRNNGSLELLGDRHGPPLAILPGCRYSFSSTTMEDGDVLVLYTDGVTEAFNATEEMYGEQRLLDTIKRLNTGEPSELLTGISQSLAEFTNGVEQSDDITMLFTEYSAKGSEGYRMSIKPSPENLVQVLAFAENIPEVNRLNGRERNLLLVSIEEVFSNLVKYGGNSHIDDIVIYTGVFDMHRQIRIQFIENGPMYNPLDAPRGVSDSEGEYATLGSGIVRTWMDYVDFQYEGGRNILTVGKIIDAT